MYLRLGPWSVHPHLVFESAAYALAFALYRWQRGRYGDPVSTDARWWVITAAAVGAALGSKLLSWLEDPAATLAHLGQPLLLFEGKTIVGGLLGGLIAVEWVKRRIGVTRSTGDLFALPLALGIAIGRVGCFLTGLADQTCGLPSHLPWAVDFGDGVPRHPTQLYEILFLVLLGAVLWHWMELPHQNGDVFKFFMVGYCAWRLAVDFLKPGTALLGLTAIQWACVGTLVYYRRDIQRWLTTSTPERATGTI
jgi:phosphatidylglycerol---prolipoprotein diacylglyceryl transferase